MKKNSFALIGGILLYEAQTVLAASTDVVISPPAGGSVLPGGSDTATDIKSSLIFSKIIPFLVSYAIGLAIAASVIALIFGGYLFLTSYANADQKDKAKKTVSYAVIGLIISLTSYGLVKILTNIQLS